MADPPLRVTATTNANPDDDDEPLMGGSRRVRRLPNPNDSNYVALFALWALLFIASAIGIMLLLLWFIGL
jgi:hypothetical protein